MKPLSGIRILDFTRLLPGPLATYWLAGLGAEVVKVEDKKLGDYAKYMGVIKNKVSLPYAILNFNKEIVFADPDLDQDKSKIIEEIKKANVLVESFRPDTMKKWGLDYESVKKLNPKLIYCSLTGFGQTGPLKNKAGHDINYLALSGVLDQIGETQTPSLSNLQLADIAGGSLPAIIGITSALYAQEKWGKGCFIDCSIFDCTFALNPILLSHFNNQQEIQRGQDLLTGAHPGYSVYQTRNSKFVALGALEKKFWESFCQCIGRPEWIDQIDLQKNWPELKLKLQQEFKQNDLEYWASIAEKHDFCLTPVLTFKESCQSEQVRERGLLINQVHPTENELTVFEIPLKFIE